MKIAASIFFFALLVVCSGLWLLSSLDSYSLSPDYRLGRPLPILTGLLLIHPAWLLIVPMMWLPFLIVLLRKKDVSVASVLIFQSTIFCAICALFVLIALAGISPWLPIDEKLAPVSH